MANCQLLLCNQPNNSNNHGLAMLSAFNSPLIC